MAIAAVEAGLQVEPSDTHRPFVLFFDSALHVDALGAVSAVPSTKESLKQRWSFSAIGLGSLAVNLTISLVFFTFDIALITIFPNCRVFTINYVSDAVKMLGTFVYPCELVRL